MKLTGNPSGFTLTELVVTLAIVGTLASVAAPAFASLIEKLRVVGAAELVYREMTFARNEAVKRSRPIYISFTADGSSTWAFGLTDRAGGCNTATTDPNAADACSIDFDNDAGTADRVLYRSTSEEYPGVSLAAPSFGVGQSIPCASGLSKNETCFDPQRGTARNGSTLFSTPRYALKTMLSTIGRSRFCTLRGDKELPGYPRCPKS